MALVNTSNATKLELSTFFNTLSGLVKALENRYTTIDLRNECCVTGKITKVDAYMNVEMEDAIFHDMRGNQKSLTNFYVNARNIRHVHIPKNADAMQLLKHQLGFMSAKKVKKKKVFKVSRAEKKQLETIRDAYKDKS